MEDTLQRLSALKRAQLKQIAQLDLQLETTPRDSRFSTALLDLMKKEETLLRDSTSAANVVQKVDDMLKQETRAFFAKVTGSNARKWQALRSKLKDDRKQLRLIATSPPPPTSKPNHITAAELEREEERLEMDYYQNWHHYETIHLQVRVGHLMQWSINWQLIVRT